MADVFKVCSRCSGSKLASEFGIDRSQPLGLKYVCKTCEKLDRDRKRDVTHARQKAWRDANGPRLKASQAEWYQLNRGRAAARDKARRPDINSRCRDTRAARFSEVARLKSGPCSDCGRFLPAMCMEFDHRPGTVKRQSVSWMVAHLCDMERIHKEIEKCDLVCRVCHRVRTFSRLPPPAPRRPFIEQKVAHVTKIKQEPCADCGLRFDTVAMDFDHSRGVKLGSIATMALQSVSMTRLLTEIKKCDLVCANCHALRTEGRRIQAVQASASPAMAL